jgi:hypothetical protein
VFTLVKGEKLRIVDVLPRDLTDVTVNFKGFVGDKGENTGEDRGYLIDTAGDLMKRYSINSHNGETYQIVISRGSEKNTLARMFVKIVPPRLEYVLFRINGHRREFLGPDDVLSLSKGDKVLLEEIGTSHLDKDDLHLQINGHRINPGDKKDLLPVCQARDNPVEVKKDQLVLGRIYIRMN